jgi:hypothetical protein
LGRHNLWSHQPKNIIFYRQGKLYKGKVKRIREPYKEKGNGFPTKEEKDRALAKLKLTHKNLFYETFTDHFGQFVIEADELENIKTISIKAAQDELDENNRWSANYNSKDIADEYQKSKATSTNAELVSLIDSLFPVLDNDKSPKTFIPPSVFNQTKDLKGETKEPWMLTYKQFEEYPRFAQFMFASKFGIEKDKRERDAETQRIIDKTRTQTKGETGEEAPDYFYADGRNLYQEIVQKAIDDSLYFLAIRNKEMTAQDAATIIESAKLEVPHEIALQVKAV